jgi:hypothetical protein
MPSILVQIDTEVDVEVEVNEFLDDCNTSEIDEVVDWLKENGHIKDTHINRQVCATELEFIEAFELEFIEALDKLYTKWNALSKEEESFIVNLAKRF